MARVMRFGMIAALVVLVGAAAACTDDGSGPSLPTTTVGSEDGSDASDTTQAPTTTEAPATTQAPPDEGATETTAPAEEDTGSNAAIWLIVIGVVIVLGIILWSIGRSSGRSSGHEEAAAAAAATTWKTYARSGYSESRWLYDNMTDGLAVWRGNAKYDGTDVEGSTASTSQANTWNQLDTRMQQATDALYGVEAAPPDQHTADTAQRVITDLKAVRAALDARADARYAYRRAEAAGEDVSDARDREQRASGNLETSRGQLSASLTNLSSLV